MTRRPPRSPLFPYTTLFRSVKQWQCVVAQVQDVEIEILAPCQAVDEPGDRLVGESARTSRANDYLEAKRHRLDSGEDAAKFVEVRRLNALRCVLLVQTAVRETQKCLGREFQIEDFDVLDLIQRHTVLALAEGELSMGIGRSNVQRVFVPRRFRAEAHDEDRKST